MARTLGSVLGRDVTYDAASVADVARYSADLAAMFEYFERVGMDVDISRLRADYPEVGWHTFADWAATTLKSSLSRPAGSPPPAQAG
jgi:hypothetical protein